MTEQETREAIERETRKWLRLPYAHGARLRGECADCTFVACVYEDAGVIPHVEIDTYSSQAHLNRESSIYINTVKNYAVQTEEPKVGDLVLYWFGRDFSHSAIVVSPGWPHVIHADMMAGFIVEAIGDQGSFAAAKKRLYFTFVK